MTSLLAKLSNIQGKAEIVIPVDWRRPTELAFLIELEDLLRAHGKEYDVREVGDHG